MIMFIQILEQFFLGGLIAISIVILRNICFIILNKEEHYVISFINLCLLSISFITFLLVYNLTERNILESFIFAGIALFCGYVWKDEFLYRKAQQAYNRCPELYKVETVKRGDIETGKPILRHQAIVEVYGKKVLIKVRNYIEPENDIRPI